MSKVCRWLASQAEQLGVEIFPGMACSELIYGKSNELKGVIAGEFGKNSDGKPGPMYEPGMEVLGKYIFLGEGVRGSLSKQVIDHYDLSKNSDFQKYGIGIKEVWDIDPEKHKFVMAFCFGGYTTNLPLEDLMDKKGSVVTTFDGKDLEKDHGGPARLLVPHLYLWKSAKWVKGLHLGESDRPGYWEQYGYHMYGDPWKEQRFWND